MRKLKDQVSIFAFFLGAPAGSLPHTNEKKKSARSGAQLVPIGMMQTVCGKTCPPNITNMFQRTLYLPIIEIHLTTSLTTGVLHGLRRKHIHVHLLIGHFSTRSFRDDACM